MSKKLFEKQAKLLEQGPLAIVKAAKNLHDQIKLWFPIEGLPWLFEQSDRAVESCTALVQVCNAHVSLTRLLNPSKRKWQPEAPTGCPFDARHLLPSPLKPYERAVYRVIMWNDMAAALEALIGVSHRIAVHYGWAGRIYDGPVLLPWTWPDVPPIASSLLQGLLHVANELERQTLPLLNELRSRIQVTKRPLTRQPTLTHTLNPTQEAALKIIRKKSKNGGGIGAKELNKELRVARIDIKQSSLTRHVIPILKMEHGVVNNRDGRGYHVPST